MHHSFYSLFYAFCAGCCIAFFAYISNSLPMAVGLHLVNNLLTFTVAAVRGFMTLSAGERLGSIFMKISVPIALAGAVYFAVIRVWRRDTTAVEEPSAADGGGKYEESLGSEAPAKKDTPICAEMIFYAVFALLSCL